MERMRFVARGNNRQECIFHRGAICGRKRWPNLVGLYDDVQYDFPVVRLISNSPHHNSSRCSMTKISSFYTDSKSAALNRVRHEFGKPSTLAFLGALAVSDKLTAVSRWIR